MRAIPLTLLFLFTVVLYACGASNAASKDEGSKIIDEAPAIVAAEKSPDQRFIDDIAANDKFAIDESSIVLERSLSPETRAIAQQMIAVHRDSTARLAAISGQVGMKIGPLLPPPSEHKKAVDSLRSLNMEQFDARYAVDQIKTHRASLTALENYAKSGASPTLRTYAANMIPPTSQHLAMAQKAGQSEEVAAEMDRQQTAP